MEVQRLIEELQDLVEHSSMFPWLGRRAVSHDQFLRLTEEIKRRLPEDLAQAAAIMENRDRLLAEASEQAKDTMERARNEAVSALEAARKQAEELLSRDEIVKAAHTRAAEIIDAAEKEAEQIRASADQYAAVLLQRLDEFIGRIQSSIAEGKRTLQETSSPPG